MEAAAPEKLSPAELAASKQAAQKLAGVWNGTLAAGAASFRLKVKITKTATGAATGTIESVDQGAKDIPLTGITCKEGVVHFEARGIGAHYDGTLSPGGVMLTGQWHQSGQAMPLEFKKACRGPLKPMPSHPMKVFRTPGTRSRTALFVLLRLPDLLERAICQNGLPPISTAAVDPMAG